VIRITGPQKNLCHRFGCIADWCYLPWWRHPRSLPTEPLEAAAIDGASRRQSFWHITLPLLRPYLLVALLLRVIFEFRAFDNIYALTGGGPANATMVLSMFTYLTSFVRFDFSLGAAASWIMLLISMITCLFFIATIRRRDTY
jgi:multiple sugar transport system permease protein